jgi:hypothetical protein
MNATTPRFVGLRLVLVERALALTPLPKLLRKIVIDRKIDAIDFVAEGNPPPFYMPAPYRRHP